MRLKIRESVKLYCHSCDKEVEVDQNLVCQSCGEELSSKITSFALDDSSDYVLIYNEDGSINKAKLSLIAKTNRPIGDNALVVKVSKDFFNMFTPDEHKRTAKDSEFGKIIPDKHSKEEQALLTNAKLYAKKYSELNESANDKLIRVGDKVKVDVPGNDFYNGRIGIVDYIDDVITVLFNDGKSPKLNNFDRNQVCKINESSTCHKLSENYWIDNKEVMDEVDRLGKELDNDGWNSYADKYTGKAYYWIFVKRENDKAIAKAIIYNHNIKPEIIDITIDQAIGQSSLDSNDALRRKLGKMLLPQNESKLVAESNKISNENSVVEFAKDCKELGYPVESYEEFSKILRDNNMTATKELYNLYVDTMNSYVVESIPIFGAKAKKDLNEFAYKIDDLKAFYNSSTSIDKEKFPNFFVWYDDMVKSGKLRTESMELNESGRYKGENKFGQNLSQEHLDELKNEPGKVFNFAKFDIFYGENKGHFPFKPCYYVTYRPSNYTSIFLDDEEILRYINTNFKESCIKESYIEIDNAVDTIDELGYAGAVEIKDNKVFADETTLRQIIDKLDYTPDIMMTMDEYSKSHAPKNEAISKATHCVYFTQDGIDQIEFEGTEDECYNYISSIESEQDDEFGDEAPERFIKKINEGIDGWDNRTGVIKRIDKYLSSNPEAVPPKGYTAKHTRAYDDIASIYGDYVTTPFGNISTDDLMQYAKDNNLLDESIIEDKPVYQSRKYSKESFDKAYEFLKDVTDSFTKEGRFTLPEDIDGNACEDILSNYYEKSGLTGDSENPTYPEEVRAYRPYNISLNESSKILPIEFNDLENIDEQFSGDTVKELEKYFKENNAAYILDELYYSKPRNVIEFDINNGDWKHEHLWAKRLIQEFFEKLDMDVSIESFETQTDGSDCYSAHYTIYPGIKKSYTADIKESAIEEDYTPDMLDDLVNHYAGRTDFATIWDEITNKFDDEDLANGVIEALELQASDLWEKYLTESKELSTDHAMISVVDQVKAVYEAGLFDRLPVGRDRALMLDISGPDKDRLAGYFNKQKEFNHEINNEYGAISHEFISDKYDIEIYDNFITMYKIPQNESLAPDGYEPKKKGVAYKVFKVKNGKLYPPMVANPGGEDTPIGVWLTADEGEFAGLSKTGRPQVKSTGSGKLSYRPGWHLGDIPRASQFDRTNKETGEKEFPKDFVWAECEYTMDVDYQPESDEQGYMRTDKDGNQYRSDKYQHSLAGLPKIPKDGYYKYRTNPRPDTVPWVITGAIKVNKLLSDDEVNEILAKHGIEPIHRQGGDKTLAELGL